MACGAKAAETGGNTPAPLTPWNVHDFGGIAGVYQRHDWASEKRAALDAWAEHVISSVEGRAGAGNIVVFERAR